MKIFVALVMSLALSACSLPVFFRVPVVQGNVVTQDNVGQLELGMTKRQVEYVMGTPLVDSSFDRDRWDYVFYYRNPRANVRKSELNLYFVDDKLTAIEGDDAYTSEILDSDDSGLSATPLPSETTKPGSEDETATPIDPSKDNDPIAPPGPARAPGNDPLSAPLPGI